MNGWRKAVSMATLVGMIFCMGMFSAFGEAVVTYQGSGTESDPYLIYTEAQLRALGEGTTGLDNPLSACYRLESDIALSDAAWVAIETFTGTFDGNAHVVATIKLLNSNGAYGHCTGFFNRLGADGVVKNLNLVLDLETEIETSSSLIYMAGIVGYNNGLVDNCSVYGSVNFGRSSWNSCSGIVDTNQGTVKNCVNYADLISYPMDYMGGIVRRNEGGLIEQCVNMGDISGTDYIGGICGVNYGKVYNCASGGTISSSWGGGIVCQQNSASAETVNCYSFGKITNGSSRSGGVVGDATGTIRNCYAAVEMPSEFGGGLVGHARSEIQVIDSYYDTEISGKTDTGKGIPLTTAEMKQQASYEGWDFTNIWAMADNVNGGYPYLRWQSEVGGERSADKPYVIMTEKQLRALGTGTNAVPDPLSAHYRLGTDITPSEEAWTPLGSETFPFNGSFDGNYHTISGLAKTNLVMAEDMLGIHAGGLFGVVGTEGKIKTLNIDTALNINGTPQSGDCLGAAAGYNRGVIEHVTVRGTISNAALAGGVAGSNYGTMRNCVVQADVSGALNSSIYGLGIGGVTAMNTGGTIADCLVFGNVNGLGNIYTGGICAENVNGEIRRCGVSGNVTVNSGGGIAATNNGTVKNCYVTGTVERPGVGGIDGMAGIVYINAGTLRNCYYTGPVVNESKYYAITGGGTVNNCYYNISAVGTEQAYGTPLTETQMRQTASFAGFDFSLIWDINPVINNGFPYLRTYHE